jgi:hypothetical protein
MSISLETVVAKYLDAKKLFGGTRKEYKSTIAKWLAWEGRVDVRNILLSRFGKDQYIGTMRIFWRPLNRFQEPTAD